MAIRVLLVDDHGVMRAGVRSLLELGPDMEVVGEARDGAEAVERARELGPDVVLMDLAMPRMGGLEATREIVSSLSQVKVLVLTMHDEEEYFFPVLEAGASGYLVKEAEPEELLAGVRAVARGDSYFSPAVARLILGNYIKQTNEGRDYRGLRPRESEVLKLAAEGLTNREIAARLFLSVRTVEKHRASLMGKLGLRNRSDLIRYAVVRGLVSTRPPQAEPGGDRAP